MQKYPVLEGQNLNWLLKLLQEASLNRLVGGIVLYDYIVGHGDDIIVSIYHGVTKPTGFSAYDVRYANVNQLGLEGTINLMLQEDWYNFNIDKQATRFTFGT
mgnify:CR=1 FL=1